MKSDKEKKAAVGILIFVAVTLVLYVVQFFYFDKTGITETEYVLSYIQEDIIEVDGFAVRDEYSEENGANKLILYKDSNKVYVPIINDSEGVAINDTIAVAFNTSDQADAYMRIEDLMKRKNELTELKSQEELGKGSLSYLNSKIYKNVIDYVSLISDGEFLSLKDKADIFCSSVTSKQVAMGYTYDFSGLITDCENTISSLEATIEGKEYVMSPCAGYFVSSVDGYEPLISYSEIKQGDIEPGTVSKLYGASPENTGSAFGKIITQHVWYMLTDISIEKAAEIKEGKTVFVDFPERGISDVPMTVYDVSDVSNGIITVTLKCKYLNEDLAVLRKEKVAITVAEYKGFKISNEALVKNSEGLDGVYVRAGNIALFTPITIVYYGDNYVVAQNYVAYTTDENGNTIVDSDKTASYRKLKVYDSIIVKGTNVEDGKVIG